ncbi:MAG: AMP-binding protein [Thermodesulfobacteriota bacterium]
MSLCSFTIYDLFKRSARLYNRNIALLFDHNGITFEELFDQIKALTGWFASKEIVKGDRIAILTKNRPEFFPLMGAVAARGAILVPINFRLSSDEMKYIFSDVEPTMLFFESGFEEMIPEISQGCSSLKELISFGSGGKNYLHYGLLLNNKPEDVVELDDNTPFMIIHTAATQGHPRGSVISHRNLLSCSIQVASTIGLTDGDVYLNILPLFHIVGLMIALTIVQVGGKNVIVSRFEPNAQSKLIDQEKVTLIGTFPPILAHLLDEQMKGECTLSSLRKVVGVDLPETAKRFESLGCGQFFSGYGQTETMGITCNCTNTERPCAAGKQGPLVDLKIVDEFDREVEVGKPGEIVIRGPLVFQGYWKQDELTRHVSREGWHHTGDLGRLDEEGYLFFVGRKSEKELIKPGGENVYPVEVEKVILQHPNVQEVSVIGVPDPKFGEGIKAVCVLKPNGKLSEQDLIDFVAARIARFKKPRYVSFVDTLPKRGDGSIDREKVKEMYGSGLNT